MIKVFLLEGNEIIEIEDEELEAEIYVTSDIEKISLGNFYVENLGKNIILSELNTVFLTKSEEDYYVIMSHPVLLSIPHNRFEKIKTNKELLKDLITSNLKQKLAYLTHKTNLSGAKEESNKVILTVTEEVKKEEKPVNVEVIVEGTEKIDKYVEPSKVFIDFYYTGKDLVFNLIPLSQVIPTTDKEIPLSELTNVTNIKKTPEVQQPIIKESKRETLEKVVPPDVEKEKIKEEKLIEEKVEKVNKEKIKKEKEEIEKIGEIEKEEVVEKEKVVEKEEIKKEEVKPILEVKVVEPKKVRTPKKDIIVVNLEAFFSFPFQFSDFLYINSDIQAQNLKNCIIDINGILKQKFNLFDKIYVSKSTFYTTTLEENLLSKFNKKLFINFDKTQYENEDVYVPEIIIKSNGDVYVVIDDTNKFITKIPVYPHEQFIRIYTNDSYKIFSMLYNELYGIK